MYKRNAFKLSVAFGTAAYCKSCAALLAYGVNSVDAMKAIGVPSQAWIGWLKGHEAYHASKGEVLPDEWTERGIVKGFREAVLTPKVRKPIFTKPVVRQEPSQEQLALEEFRKAARPVIHQRNGRQDNKPVLRPLDTTAFSGLGKR